MLFHLDLNTFPQNSPAWLSKMRVKGNLDSIYKHFREVVTLFDAFSKGLSEEHFGQQEYFVNESLFLPKNF